VEIVLLLAITLAWVIRKNGADLLERKAVTVGSDVRGLQMRGEPISGEPMNK
jgi:hypothetical protein